MKPDQRSLLLHPAFITGVALMLVNDLYWKYEYHNWFTGKLSDIAGMIVLPVFLTVIFPRYKKTMFIIAALFFIAWKSPLVQPVIDFANKKMDLPVARTIDYTDLICLGILPLTYMLRPWQMNTAGLYKKSAIAAAGCITVFTLCSTSMPRHLYAGYEEEKKEDKVFIDRGFHVRDYRWEDDVVSTLKEKGVDVRVDTTYYTKIRPYQLYADMKDSSGTMKKVKLEGNPDITLYRRLEPVRVTHTIPVFVLGSDTLRNISFGVSPRKKGCYFHIASFEYSDPATDKLPNIKSDYGKFFAKPLAKKLERLLKQ